MLILNFAVNTLNDTSTKSPRPKTNATALVSWIETCLYYIVAAMLEYAILLASNMMVSYVHKKRRCGYFLDYVVLHLDKLMVLLFPTVFSIHAFTFWTNVAISQVIEKSN